MGLTPHEYYCMSPLEFHYASKGYLRKQWQEWDRTRHVMYIVAGTVKTKKRLPKLSTWFPLPIDKESHAEDDIQDMFTKLKEKLKNGKRTTS